MRPIFTAEQTRQLDQYTIEHEPIASIDLMERASSAFVQAFEQFSFSDDKQITLLCGIGNNGGDGFAVARLLHEKGYRVNVIHALISEKLSPDCANNKARLPKSIPVKTIESDDQLPLLKEQDILIDALFGSGLSRPIEGYWSELILHFNQMNILRVAIDMPSGLFDNRHSEGTIFNAHYTISFQFPKLAFFFAENHKYVGDWKIVDIGLSEKGIGMLSANYFYLTNKEVAKHLKIRAKFDHKGTYGHALIVAGSYGKIGAAILSAKASLKIGAGLVSTHIPKCAYDIMQISLPEAMVFTDRNNYLVTDIGNLDAFKAIGIGPGLGTNPLSAEALEEILKKAAIPLVLDADALNIISENPKFFKIIPPNSILTPHPKEFERLFGKATNEFERLKIQQEQSQLLQIYIILKGGHTCITSPDGKTYFSTAGNPGMGTAGAGDVLTGMLTGLLAQAYNSLEACLLGVHLHGMAGDWAAQKNSMPSVIAGDIIDGIGTAYLQLQNY